MRTEPSPIEQLAFDLPASCCVFDIDFVQVSRTLRRQTDLSKGHRNEAYSLTWAIFGTNR